MNTNKEWIKMSERKPTEADLPVWLHNPAANDDIPTWMQVTSEWRNLILATHWRPAAADIPAPPKEETQVNKDTKAYVEKYGCASPSMVLKGATCYTSDIWRAALAYERAEVAKMLPVADVNTLNYREIGNAYESIRARCGGAK